jgi:hypothetical protein
MKKIKQHAYWIVPAFVFLALLLPPGTYWKWYWFNMRIMEKVNSIITSLS